MQDTRELDEDQIQDLIREAKENDFEVEGATAVSEVTEDWSGPVKAGFAPNVKSDGPAQFHKPAAVSVDIDAAFGKEAPIERRTAQARVDSLSSKMWEEAIKNPELMEQLCRRIQGEAWKSGRTVSYDEVRAAAAELLRRAERQAS